MQATPEQLDERCQREMGGGEWRNGGVECARSVQNESEGKVETGQRKKKQIGQALQYVGRKEQQEHRVSVEVGRTPEKRG